MSQLKRSKPYRHALAALIIIFTAQAFLPAATINDTQIIKSDHWVNDAIFTLYTRAGQSCPAGALPITVGQLKFLLRQLDTEDFDETTMKLYKNVHDFLYEDEDFVSMFMLDGKENNGLKFNTSPRINPEFYIKSNDNIDWFFARKDPYLVDNFATLPVKLGFGNSVTLETDLFYGKSRAEARLKGNWTNLPIAGNFDFLLPRFAYGSTGVFKEEWGMSFHIGNEGLTLGKTHTGSIIYNRTFETASYAELNLFSKWATYALDVVQVDFDRFMYLHHLEIRPFKQLRLALVEGGLVHGPMEIRYLNPLMIVHSYYPNEDYVNTQNPAAVDTDRKYCAYMGIMVDYLPCKNLRLYALWAQNEMQAFGELNSDRGKTIPDSYGLQTGLETYISGDKGRLWQINFESVYTLPYLYIKQSPQASLYKARNDWRVAGGAINSWIGTPFGPDCLAFQTGVKCGDTGVWSVELNYILAMHGEIDFSIFTSYEFTGADGKKYYAYYPEIRALVTPASLQDCIKEARDHWLSGTLEYRHDIALKGSYTLNDYCSFDGQFVYSFIFNKGHESGNFQQGVELALSASFKYF